MRRLLLESIAIGACSTVCTWALAAIYWKDFTPWA